MAKRGQKKQPPAPAVEEQAAGLAHNSAVRDEYIKKSFAELFAMDGDIDDAKETHVAPLTRERTKLRRQMKTDLGFNDEDMKVMYALYKRSRTVEQFEDAGKKADATDALREIWKSLNAGDQLCFLDAVDLEQGDDGKDLRPSFLRNQEAAGSA